MIHTLERNDDNLFQFENNCFDLIRYWAVISVMLLHYTGYALRISEMGLAQLQIIRNIISFFPGVVIFFSMSGFLVSASLERSKSTKEFFIKRVFRMYPELWACTIVNLIVAVLLVGKKLDKSIIVWLGTQIFGIANTPRCLDDWATGSINGALWTVFVQIQLYVVLAFFYNWLKRRSLTQWIIILVIAAGINVITGILIGDSKDTVGEIVRRIFLGYAIWFLIGVFIYIYRDIAIPILKKTILPLILLYIFLKLPISIPGYYANIAIGVLCPLIFLGGGTVYHLSESRRTTHMGCSFTIGLS